MKVETKVENAIDSIVKEQGFEIEYVEFVKEGSNNVLRVVIDKPNKKMWVDDCEKVSRAIEDTVDKNIEQEYVLEVSSPGLERQLKTIRLYKKYIGKEAHVKLYKKLDDLKEFNAVIENVNEEDEIITFTLEDGNSKELSLKEIATAYTTYDFDAALKGNTDNVNLNKLNKIKNR